MADRENSILQAQETFQVLQKISDLLDTGLDPEVLAICVRLCENGINPEGLAMVIQELRKENMPLKQQD